MAAVIFKCNSRLEPSNDGSPRSLIKVIAPSEYNNQLSLAPVQSAISAFYRTGKAVAGKTHPARGHKDIQRLLTNIENRLQNRPILNVDVNDAGNTLLIEEVRYQVFAQYNIHTVVSGDEGQCDPALKDIAIRLTELIQDLNAHLYPNAPRPENPS